MKILRASDDRFKDLPGYAFAPHYMQIGDTRMHLVDEGDGAEVILCLHGEPTWSYLYRDMIPPLAEHYRVVAPDMVGFGKSDKYAEAEAYSFQMHYDKLLASARKARSAEHHLDLPGLGRFARADDCREAPASLRAIGHSEYLSSHRRREAQPRLHAVARLQPKSGRQDASRQADIPDHHRLPAAGGDRRGIRRPISR